MSAKRAALVLTTIMVSVVLCCGCGGSKSQGNGGGVSSEGQVDDSVSQSSSDDSNASSPEKETFDTESGDSGSKDDTAGMQSDRLTVILDRKSGSVVERTKEGGWNRVFDQEYEYPLLYGDSRDRYPELQKTLERSMEEYVAERENFAKDCLEMYEEMGGQEYYGSSTGQYMTENYKAGIVRADDEALSVIYDYDSYGGGAHGYYASYADNYDTKTGDKLKLTDVVKDEDAFFNLVEERLKSDYPDVFPELMLISLDEYRKNVAEQGTDYNWLIDYDGLTMFFNPYDLASYAAGAQIVNIPFSEAPDIFEERFQNYEGNYIIPISQWQEKYLDVDADGEAEKVVIESELDEYDYVSFKIKVDNKSVETESNFFYSGKTYIVRYNNKYYIYLFGTGDNDYSSLLVCDLSALDINPDWMSCYPGEMEFSYRDWEEGGYSHYSSDSTVFALTDPDNIKLSTYMDILGTQGASGDFRFGESDGFPKLKGDTYTFNGTNLIRTKNELLCDEVDVDGNVIEATQIPERTYLLKAKTDGDTWVDVQIISPDVVDTENSGDYVHITSKEDISFDESKPIYRIHLEKTDGYMRKVNGIDEESMFDGIMYAG